MERFEKIESQLVELVKGCLNDKEFMTKPIKIDELPRGSYGSVSVYTGVTLSKSSVMVKSVTSSVDYKQIKELCHGMTIHFEHEPKITISYHHTSHKKKEGWSVKTLERKCPKILKPIQNLFVGNTYEVPIKETTITYEYNYKLVCGGFEVILTNEVVQELVDLYETNTTKFIKLNDADEIEKRIEKFVK